MKQYVRECHCLRIVILATPLGKEQKIGEIQRQYKISRCTTLSFPCRQSLTLPQSANIRAQQMKFMIIDAAHIIRVTDLRGEIFER